MTSPNPWIDLLIGITCVIVPSLLWMPILAGIVWVVSGVNIFTGKKTGAGL